MLVLGLYEESSLSCGNSLVEQTRKMCHNSGILQDTQEMGQGAQDSDEILNVSSWGAVYDEMYKETDNSVSSQDTLFASFWPFQRSSKSLWCQEKGYTTGLRGLHLRVWS